MKEPNYLVPILTTEAGRALTMENWQAAGITTVSYHLFDLMMKPGLVLLKEAGNLRAYCGWRGPLVLNARLPTLQWRSSYDGQLIQINQEEVDVLIQHLAPDCVLTSAESEAPLKMPYLVYDELTPFTDFKRLVLEEEASIYLIGNFNWEQIKELLAIQRHWIETDRPAKDALQGLLYTENGLINLKESLMQDAQVLIESGCSCKTCQQQLTRAYLHHLLQHCPLLCQRFLIAHNIEWLGGWEKTVQSTNKK